MTRKFALVIGNSHYEDPALARLKAPEADVHALASVLRDPAIGGFDEVNELVDEPEFAIRRAIATFFANKAPNDLLLLYASGHGVLDEQGRLYLATRDTQRNLLNATAIPASFITDDMDTCRSKRQVLILDCCHSGAFARGAKGELAAITQATFEGNGFGRVVLTASDSTQYALEGDQVEQSVSLSLFTNYLLEGLTSGEADRGGDGWIDVDEWYDYAYEKILMQTSSQTPKKWAYNTQGELVIARNPRPKPVELPRYLRTAIGSELPRVRLESVDQLENLLSNGAPGMVAVATQELQRMAQDDDSLIVRKRASEVLAAHPGIVPAEGETVPRPDEMASQVSHAQQELQAAQEREKQQAEELLEKERTRKAEAERLRQEQEKLLRQQEQERQAQQAREAQQARQQARFEDLYQTVVSKLQAGEWLAAQSSLEQLQQLQPGYRDLDKLQKKIAQEIAREKSEREHQAQQARQAQLEARYQEASQAMQRKDWPEAQRLFEQLAQEAPGYRDVSKRLKAITGRLAGEQTAAVPSRGGWLPVLATSLGWGIAWVLLVPLVDAYKYDNIILIAIIPALLIAAGVVYSLILASLPISRARLVQLFILWFGGVSLALGSAGYGTLQNSIFLVIVLPFALTLTIFAGSGLLLRASLPSVRWISILGGWMLGVLGGVFILIPIGLLFNFFGGDSVEARMLSAGLTGLVIGAIGGGWMHRQLQPFSTLTGESTGVPRTQAPIAGAPKAGALRTEMSLRVSIWRNWSPVLVTSLGWGIALMLLVPLVDAYRYDNIFRVVAIPALFIAGGFVYSLVVAGVPLSRVQLAMLSLIWWVGSALAIGLAVYPGWEGNLVMATGMPIVPLLATLVGTGLLMRTSLPSLRWISTLGGWAIALIVGFFIINSFLINYDFGSTETAELSFGLVGLVIGAIGGGWMHRQLGAFSVPTREPAGSPMAALITGLGWGLGWAVLGPLLNSDQIFFGATIPALFMAASTVAAINMVAGNQIPQSRLGQLFAIWWAGIALALGFAALPDWQGDLLLNILIPIVLILAAFAGSGLLLRLSIPSISWISILGGFSLGLVVGAIATTVIRPIFPYADLHIFGLHDLGGGRVLGFGGLVAGLISGGWIRWQLRKGPAATDTAAPAL